MMTLIPKTHLFRPRCPTNSLHEVEYLLIVEEKGLVKVFRVNCALGLSQAAMKTGDQSMKLSPKLADLQQWQPPDSILCSQRRLGRTGMKKRKLGEANSSCIAVCLLV